MNRPGRNTLLLIALLLAVVVAYFSDPVLSDPSRDTETTETAALLPTPTAMSIQTSATTTPPTATTTPAVNSPPTVQVMTFGGFGQARPFPADEVYKVNISGSRVSIKLRGQDDDGNLAYLAIVDEDDEIQGQSDCDATMGSECTLEVTVPSPAEYDRAFTYYGVAVDSDGAISEKSARIEITSVSDSGSYASIPTPSPTPAPVPVPTPDPMTPPPEQNLSIDPPEDYEPFISNLPSVIRPQVSYDGSYQQLSYTLVNEPIGMSIDSDDGIITWTPREADEGQTLDVTVSVTDGVEVAETTLQVTVVEPEEIETVIVESMTDRNKLTVTDDDTTLKGLEITSPQGEEPIASAKLTELKQVLQKAPLGSVPDIPSRITPISDVFIVSSTFDNPVELSFPLSALPDGISIDDVDLYAYVSTTAHDAREKFWSTVVVDLSFGGTAEDPVYVVELAGLEGMAFFGYREPATQMQSMSSIPTGLERQSQRGRAPELPSFGVGTLSLSATSTDTSKISCVRDTGQVDDYTCTASTIDPDIRIKVIDFPIGTGWASNSTVEDLAGWIIHAQRGFSELDLGYDKEITVKIEHMPGKLGWVTGLIHERRRTLHITNDASELGDVIEAVVLHEYFHHAQGHSDTKITFTKNGATKTAHLLISITYWENTDWLIEGTADWFPDELKDTLNDYAFAFYSVTEVGIDAYPDPDYDQRRNPYSRFLFFKLLHEKCSTFHSHIKSLLNDRSGSLIGGRGPGADKTGIENLSNTISV